MGTRSLVVLPDEDGKSESAVLYRQFDGYPTGMGEDLVALLAGRTIVNGFGLGQTTREVYNGAGDLSASVIAGLKMNEGEPTLGEVYLFAAGTRDTGEEFIYTVTIDGKRILLKVEGYGNVLFDGDVNDWPGGEELERMLDDEI